MLEGKYLSNRDRALCVMFLMLIVNFRQFFKTEKMDSKL